MGLFSKLKKQKKDVVDKEIKKENLEKELEKEDLSKPKDSVENLEKEKPIDETEILETIKDESIPVIKSDKCEIIFRRDYENRRIILNNNILETLIKNNQLEECISYLRDKDLIDYITVFVQMNQKVGMIDFYINGEKTYLVPMNYADEINNVTNIVPDDKIHYTKNALDLEIKAGKKIEEDIEEGRSMKFSSIKNPDTNKQYLPLFKTKEELRIIFPSTKYRIGEMTYKEAVKFAKEFEGVVFRPTKESFVISNEVADYFTGICEYKKHYTNYRKYTENEKTLEEKIQKIGIMEKGSKEADLYYKGILQNIFDLDKIYIALSKGDLKNGESIPIALTKDKEPAIYMFSDLSYAKEWAEHYNNISNATPLVGCIKSDKNFDSIFSIAKKLGITLCMFNEGQTLIGFDIGLFMEVNNMSYDMNVRLSEEEAKKVMENKANEVKLKFNRYNVIGMEQDANTTKYYELRLH